jgi:predicted dehydrogenase
MKVIHVGLGQRWQAWIDIVRGHRDASSVAVVSAGDASGAGGNGLTRYPTLDEALRHVEADAAILTGALAFEDGRAVEILEAGLGIILDRPPACSLPLLMRLARLSHEHDRSIVILRGEHGTSDRTLRRLLGKVGTITDVSYRDQRPWRIDGVAPDAPYAQLACAGLHHIESLSELLAAKPVRIAARCGGPAWRKDPRGATTEVFLELENNIHAQYFVASGRAERELWIEGSRGSLRSDGRVTWWRKRGWPRFAPWRWQPRTAAASPWPDRAVEALDQMKLALSDAPSAGAARAAARWPIALLGSVIQSDQEGIVVGLDAWLRTDSSRAKVASAAE